jgi:protein O-mannosyl-transferase
MRMSSRLPLFISIALVILVLPVYIQVAHFEFVNYDDPDYVTNNPHIVLRAANVWWAITSGYAGNWIPVSWLSHMIDFQLYGLRGGGHHISSVALHILSTLLLFHALRLMTGALWKSAWVAALFALHPLRVESVAWVAERKDVLCTLFSVLALLLYARYAQKPQATRFAWVLLAFTFAVLSKPMAVTLPFLLLVLDFWPLQRFAGNRLSTLIQEKLPLVGLSCAVSIINYVVQRRAEAVVSLDVVSFTLRLENAVISYVAYVRMLMWPTGLAPFYPMPSSIPAAAVIAAALALVTITAIAWLSRRSRPYVMVGWLWYVGSLVPVIGIVSFGAQARADRYTYFPSIGLLIMIVWAAAELMSFDRRLAYAVIGGGCVALASCLWLSRRQTSYWHDSVALFRRTLVVSPDNYVAHNNLGIALLGRGDLDEAIIHFQKATTIPRKIDFADPYVNLGHALLRAGRSEEAIQYLTTALNYNPNLTKAHTNLGIALDDVGKTSEAAAEFRAAVTIDPDNPEAHAGLAVALAKLGAADEAIAQAREAVRLNPDAAAAAFDLGQVYGLLEQPANAEQAFRESLRHNASNPTAELNLGLALSAQEKYDEAVEAFRAAIRLKPDYVNGWFNLGSALAQLSRFDEAITAFQEALWLRPDFDDARHALETARRLKD